MQIVDSHNPNHERPTPRGRLSRVERRKARRKRGRRRLIRWTLGTIGSGVVLVLALIVIGFATPGGTRIRMLLAETVLSTRHYYLAKYMTTPAEYKELLKELNSPVVNTGVPAVKVAAATTTSPVQIHAISGQGWNGYVVLIHNPRLIRLVHANVQGSMGEYITDMAKRVGAIAGVNASGFEDPNGEGWGGVAVGLELVGGQEFSEWKPSWPVVGFTQSGVMVMGDYTLTELQAMGVRDAMQFHPELVVNGQPQITEGDGGWGQDPRTAIGQTKNGTVIFVVANGRFHGGAGLGASQRQIMDVMLQYGAYNACALDGGSSSVLYADGRILNSPSTLDPNGQRHLPDAWMVFPTVEAADQYTP
ncbi:phosphodiester glycosidase family protein [Alicyclobacillus cycloheptanicus]|jgi:exopolysaccharide biosynthesis protein|uniref:Exopolysaccharide biosynthesis protein n=1 Tax=Alicyclobacillus cycloheptanicus TaxID=1457 RepID=A0ABT9XI75_9BACL|nr:phosphodiester glycosidase family protein [Alicyclobacillus cycloheptanicus]MDQ0190011.1 exopolysaccharide biosynthesis protein [Alicyclobacillus cycloheptanicus]WDM00084.1 phosphodiester glycosidase family protein [Alicyclobacillus cycloheptanicus]